MIGVPFPIFVCATIVGLFMSGWLITSDLKDEDTIAKVILGALLLTAIFASMVGIVTWEVGVEECATSCARGEVQE